MFDFSECPHRMAQLVPCFAQNAPRIDSEGAFPVEEFTILQEADLLSAPVPTQYGGAGLGTAPDSTLSLLQTLWHVGRGNLSVGRLYEGHVNALQLVHWFGDENQKQSLFADARAGHIFGVWNTQAGNGIRFEPSEDGCTIQGAKTFCSGAGHVSRPIVTGERADNGGWQMAVVPIDEKSVTFDASWWKPMGMRASASFQTDFSGVQLCSNDLLGKGGDYYQQPAFSGGAIRFCAVQLGGAASLLETTRDFLVQVGRSEDPFQRARVGQMVAKVQSGWQWLQSAAQMWENRDNAVQMVAFAAMMRVATEEICNAVLEMAEKSVGARGLMRPSPIERISRDLTMYLKQPHLDEIPVRVGKWVLESGAPAHELWTTVHPTLTEHTNVQAQGCGG